MNRTIFTITVGMLALVAAMLVLGAGTGGAIAARDGSASVLQAQSVNASQPQQPAVPLVPITTAFTYQGYLAESGSPANGQFDFEFRLFDAVAGGVSIGSVVARSNQTVSNGVFTVSLDFGSLNGTAGWLEINVRRVGGGNYITLTPRQQMTPAPYAITLRPGAIITGTTGPYSPILLVQNHGGSFDNVTIRGVNSGLMGSAGVRGEATGRHGSGVVGTSSDGGYGVQGNANGGYGVYGSSNSGIAVYGDRRSINALAGKFNGNVEIIGNLSKGGGSFKIDHPLDPANKYLYHSFVESPDMMNIYNGNVVLDAKGEATVTLPDWFGALNKEYRYQLTAIGAPGPNLYVSREVEQNRFSIAGGTGGMKVSWQVTGIRKDAYAEKNRIPVEEAKEGDEKGRYLYPEEQGQPESKGMEYERLQQLREEAEKPKP